MEFSYSAQQERLRESVVAFGREQLNGSVIERDRQQVFARNLWEACAQHGLAGLPVAGEYGGQGLDPMSCAIALEALGYVCHDHGLVFGLCAHLVSVVVPLARFGTAAQKARFLPGLCDGTLIGAHAMTEAESGSDAFAMQARATREGDTWRIDGTKLFVTNGTHADVIIVFALTDPDQGFHGGVTAFLVEPGTAGLRIGPSVEKMGLRTVPFGTLTFDSVRVGDDAVLGGLGGGAGVFGHSMDWERACLFAAHVGQMQRLMERAVDFAQRRQVEGKPLGKQQAVSHTIANMKIRLEAARLLTYRAAGSLVRARGASLDSAIAKVFVSEALVQTALDTVQIFGARGYATEQEVERALRDAIGAKIYSGTSEVQRNIIAGWLGL